ncbi:MAG: hypothetical protein QOK25_3118 [Thermoleophilaceae bacterium]|jgi:O-antigen/teichoic acid export membrane protein|nr:hypothetical protein [Thermoleophilaceae bacterium]
MTSSPTAAEEPKARGFSFRRDMLVTVGGQAAVMVGGLLLYRLLALEKGAAGLASYALIKQLVVFSFPAVLLGLGTGIPRYVALSEDSRSAAETYLLAAVLITGAATVVVSALALVSPRTTAVVLLGNRNREHLVPALVATLVATVFLEVVAGYLRGRLDFARRTLLLVVGVAGLPVVLLLAIPEKSVQTLILLMAAGLFAMCVAVVALPLARAVAAGVRRVRGPSRVLLNYGIRRIPGEFAAIVLFTFAPVLAAHFAPLKQVAYLTAGLQILAVVTIAFQSIGLVFLPVLSRLFATDRETARRYVALLAACALHIAIFATPQLLLFADVAARAWLGPDFAGAGPVIRVMIFPVAFFIFYSLLHISLDAAAVKSYNSRNRLIASLAAVSAAALLLSLGIGRPIMAVAEAFALGVFVLGLLTLVSVSSVIGIGRSEYLLRASIPLGLAAAAAGFGVRAAIEGSTFSIPVLLLVVAAEVVLLALYVAGLVRAGATWPAELRSRLLRRGA